MRAIALRLEQGFKESWGTKIQDGVARAGGEVAEGTGEVTFAHAGGTGQQHVSVIEQPLGRAEFEDELFV